MRALCAIGLALVVACSPTLTPKEQSELTTHALTLEHCKAVARDTAADAGGDAGLSAYDDCKKEAGIQ